MGLQLTFLGVRGDEGLGKMKVFSKMVKRAKGVGLLRGFRVNGRWRGMSRIFCLRMIRF